ncbi:hypothetical protein PPTG_07385 [Phytophthora nicotianae INRA-310]|uniref:Uncharacterized protein n=1 Tax=Phytophthora nicotianae (strain INRA-310) TaxID=761204 RepID=W2QQ32_PHYN3|nr:hypothetical protein PPTG_07385 [Phytophthora nicotianae INRA-310]ETN15223.1 hypothetical protein PPTG_07385 [Phytophthora nicotianae INRA-310]
MDLAWEDTIESAVSELEDDDVQGRLLLFLVIVNEGLCIRAERVFRQRSRWAERVDQLETEGMFYRTYRMSVVPFNKLLSLLGNDVDESRSMPNSLLRKLCYTVCFDG